jgi:hypothetical protein
LRLKTANGIAVATQNIKEKYGVEDNLVFGAHQRQAEQAATQRVKSDASGLDRSVTINGLTNKIYAAQH